MTIITKKSKSALDRLATALDKKAGRTKAKNPLLPEGEKPFDIADYGKTVSFSKAKDGKSKSKFDIASFMPAKPLVEPRPELRHVKAPLSVNARLFDMLSVKRPHGSAAERAWCDKYLMPYKPTVFGNKTVDAYAITVGEGSRTLFSAHVDTVHRKEGPQTLCYDPILNHIFKDDEEPLGADDGSGVWLLLEMIDAGVPGTYLFTRGEEYGGIGAKAMADYEHKFLSEFDRAIAFDRKRCDSVITKQGGTRCCSEDFGNALADALNMAQPDFMYSTDDTGVYTDTKEYIGYIAECTNVSVGYEREHTALEMQDLGHLMKLRDACIAIDWEALPVVRVPKKEDPMDWYYGGSSFGRSYLFGGNDDSEADAYMTREDMIDFAIKDPEGFVDKIRMDFFGE